MKKDPLKFTGWDIFHESIRRAGKGHVVEAVKDISTAIGYNKARDIGDPEEIVAARRRLTEDMATLRKNYISMNRGNEHWRGLFSLKVSKK